VHHSDSVHSLNAELHAPVWPPSPFECAVEARELSSDSPFSFVVLVLRVSHRRQGAPTLAPTLSPRAVCARWCESATVSL